MYETQRQDARRLQEVRDALAVLSQNTQENYAITEDGLGYERIDNKPLYPVRLTVGEEIIITDSRFQ